MQLRHFRFSCPLAIAVLFSAAFACAQTTATVSGVVTDTTGAVLPNASVHAVGVATGVERDATSDAAGIYICLRCSRASTA